MVYFLKSIGLGAIKIGYTKDDRSLEIRITTLQSQVPDKLELVAIIRNVTIKYEKELHERFRYLRYRGEWYSLGKDLRDFINHNAEIVDRDLLNPRITKQRKEEFTPKLKYYYDAKTGKEIKNIQ